MNIKKFRGAFLSFFFNYLLNFQKIFINEKHKIYIPQIGFFIDVSKN